MNRFRTILTPLAAALLALAAPSALAHTRASEPAPSEAEGRVVILGFDGADARTVRELMEKEPGRYPTFEKLAASGTFAPLEVVVPTESPVSWASLNSGQNPAKTGVPGFIKRKIGSKTPVPDFGYIERKDRRLEDLEDAPLPLWSPTTTAAVAGGAAFLAVLLVALLLFRRLVVAAVLGLLVGGGAAYAGHRARSALPASYPHTANVNQVESFWDYAARAGVPCVVLDAAQSFDAPTTSGAKVLHGLGLPDARNELGQWSIYTTDPAQFSREGKTTTTAGTVYRVDDEGGVIRAKVFGPKNFALEQELLAEKEALAKELEAGGGGPERLAKKSELEQRLAALKKENLWTELLVRLDGEQARVTLGGTEQTLAPGQWSEFYDLTFELNWLVQVKAITRVKLIQLQPHFELLVNVLDIDPRDPPFWQPISSPHGFASELAEECGLYETYGWPTLTMPFKDEKIDAETLLEDVEFTERWRETLTHQRLAKDDWRMLMSVFSTTDRVQHMTYQFYDPTHPLYDAAAAGREMTFFGERIKLSQAIPAIYRQMDRIIGDVLAKLRPEDTLMVISDHGFQSFRRQVHVNNWLHANGYLVLRPDFEKKHRDGLAFVDWSKTRAYALGLGFIYLNLEGREPGGIVSRDEARPLMEEIRAKLLEARDPDNDARICKDVYILRDIHDGKHIGLEADLLPGFFAPYRVGWSLATGGISTVEKDGVVQPGPICTDNDSNWSGDHVSMALSEVRGVFFSNKKVTLPPEGVRALQIAPTALDLLGVPVPPEMDLPPLEIAR